MSIGYSALKKSKVGAGFKAFGHDLEVKARTHGEEWIFAELGDDYDDCYLLAVKDEKFASAVFHVHLDLPSGNRFELDACEWLFKNGDVYEAGFAEQVLNQAEGTDYVYKQIHYVHEVAKVETAEGEMKVPVTLALYHCKDGPSDPYFLICEYGEGLDSGLSCLVGEKFIG